MSQVERVNEAMKKGVTQILDEEERTSTDPAHINQDPAARPPATSSFADLWTLALSCAIGAPIEDDYPWPEQRHSSSSGVGWISASSQSAKDTPESAKIKVGSTE